MRVNSGKVLVNSGRVLSGQNDGVVPIEYTVLVHAPLKELDAFSKRAFCPMVRRDQINKHFELRISFLNAPFYIGSGPTQTRLHKS